MVAAVAVELFWCFPGLCLKFLVSFGALWCSMDNLCYVTCWCFFGVQKVQTMIGLVVFVHI